ncbi:MAG: adaptor protein MecA [Roseburia sp.]
MEIKRIGENKIRCALTEHEIKDMGFDIDEIIGDSETTQKFMRDVLNLVEEQEHINMDHISPMVRAELLPDHSMAITFGGDADMGISDLVETVTNLMEKIAPERLEEFRRLNAGKGTKEPLEDIAMDTGKEKTAETKKQPTEKPRMVCALRFLSLADATRMCRVCFREKLPESALYKLDGEYYLILNFDGFEKQEMRPFAFGAMEYDEGHISEETQIAFIMEQGSQIVKSKAVEALMQL